MTYTMPNGGLTSRTGPRCTRTRYVALAVLLGPLGIHNFVAGYRFRGLIQLGLSVASLGLLSPVSAVWALVEAVVVKGDGDGVPFRALADALPPDVLGEIRSEHAERYRQAA